MTTLRDRIAALESALQNSEETEIASRTPESTTPIRHSMDHRFDKIAPEVDAAPAPTPSQDRSNPFEAIPVPSKSKSKYYDNVAAAYGLGILDVEAFIDYTVYDAFVTNLRICPVQMTDNGRFYYVEHRSFLPNVPGTILRKGTEKTGPALGVANLPLQGVNTFGIGDFERNPSSMVWEKMGNAGFWTHMRYEFQHEMEVEVRDENGVKTGELKWERKVFNWI